MFTEIVSLFSKWLTLRSVGTAVQPSLNVAIQGEKQMHQGYWGITMAIAPFYNEIKYRKF